MVLELLAEKLIYQNNTEISDEIDIITNEQDYHYMLIKKSVVLKKSLLSEEELVTFDDQDSFEIIISVEIDDNKYIVYDDHAKLYAYAPTEVFTGCGFNIHAPFRLDSHRKHLLECAFNDYIFQNAAKAVGDNLIYRLKSLDVRDIYKILYFERKDIEMLDYFHGYLVETIRDKEIFYSYQLERYFALADILIANDKDFELFGETLYGDKKLLVCVENEYQTWLIENFQVEKLSGEDIINNIEYIVQRDLFDAVRLGMVYKHLLDCVNLESEKIKDKKILPVFEEDKVIFVSGFDVDVFYLYDDTLSFEFESKLKSKFNFLHEVVTFPDVLNRYESIGIKEYNQRNILLKLKEIFLATDDEALKIQISRSILKQSKLLEENWDIVKEILMLPTSDGKWHLVSEKTVFYPNEVLMDMYEKSLFLNVDSFIGCFRGGSYVSFLERVGVWFIPDPREEISNAHDLYFELCENWGKYRQLLNEKKIDKHFFDNLKEVKFIPIEDDFYTIDEVIFLSDGAQKYQKSLGHLSAFKNINYEENCDLVETLNFKHIDHDRKSVFENLLNCFVLGDSEKVLDFIMDFTKEDKLSFLWDLEFFALKNDGVVKIAFKEMIFADSVVFYDDLPVELKKSVPFFPLFDKKYVSYFKRCGKSLRESLHTSIIHHGTEEKSEKYRFYLPYINKMTKMDFDIDLKFEKFSFYEVKNLQVKFTLDGMADIHKRDYFIRGDHCYLDFEVCDNPKKLAKMYQSVFEKRAHKKLPLLNYEIEKFLTDRPEFMTEKKLPDAMADFKDRVVDYFLSIKDISNNEPISHKGYDFVERIDGRSIFCSIKENIDNQNIFKMSSEEIKKAEHEGENYRVYLIESFKEGIPVYTVVDDIARLLEDNRILVSTSEYHLIML